MSIGLGLNSAMRLARRRPSDGGATPANARRFEDGTVRKTEDGTTRITEGA